MTVSMNVYTRLCPNVYDSVLGYVFICMYVVYFIYVYIDMYFFIPALVNLSAFFSKV